MTMNGQSGAFGNRVLGGIVETRQFVLLFPFHASILEPNLDLSFGQAERVRNLDAMLDQLRAADVRVEDNIEQSEQGRFAWAYDLEGNKFELWEPPAAA